MPESSTPEPWDAGEPRTVRATIHTKDGHTFTDREPAELTREQVAERLHEYGRHAAMRGYFLVSARDREVLVLAENLSHISYGTDREL